MKIHAVKMKNYKSLRSILTPEQVLSLFFTWNHIQQRRHSAPTLRRTTGGKLNNKAPTLNWSQQNRLRTGTEVITASTAQEKKTLPCGV